MGGDLDIDSDFADTDRLEKIEKKIDTLAVLLDKISLRLWHIEKKVEQK